ncbi:hypothetical protein [Flavimaricola marinus]|uniref:Oligosaccharide biosynthesis protein Alg14 like protein n=1 Tax=Flavimaricola marinus TaxID=1819565 RepID=A0A238LI00_9RHOB|nr:hypothetical protein [Flavimaricola marinus]SMY09309.1 Oligosaccharide biosynthesis protein Alg14 like protein [Flavimaricola marinus]
MSKRVLAVASGGGHWIQLLRLKPAWDGCQVSYVTTTNGFRADLVAEAQAKDLPIPGYWVVSEANRKQKLRLLRQLLKLTWIVLRVRPHAIVTTGASVGYFAIRLGKLVGAKCIWIDSIANAEVLSMSGQMVGPHADLWLTQWPDIATEDGPAFEGSVL